MADCCHLEKRMDKLLYISNGLTDYDEILHADAYLPSKPQGCSKNQFSKISRWRTAAILKNVKCDISEAVQPNLMKFGMTMHIIPPKPRGNQKFKKMKLQDGRRRPT